MTVRPLRPSDIPKLEAFYRQQGFDYTFPDLNSALIETVHVVADENDEPLCAVIAERMVQLYFIAGDFGPPHARIHAIRLLHDSMRAELKRLGYPGADAFLPPSIADKFGHWLERRFRWLPNWKSWTVRI